MGYELFWIWVAIPLFMSVIVFASPLRRKFKIIIFIGILLTAFIVLYLLSLPTGIAD